MRWGGAGGGGEQSVRYCTKEEEMRRGDGRELSLKCVGDVGEKTPRYDL